MDYERAKNNFCAEVVKNHLFKLTEKEAETVFAHLWEYMMVKPDKAGMYLADLMNPS